MTKLTYAAFRDSVNNVKILP